MKAKKKHQTDRTNLEQLSQLFEHFNEMYNTHFFLNNQPKTHKDEQ
jgi:hypothetical protein